MSRPLWVRIRFDNGLYLDARQSRDTVHADFTLMGAADGSIMTPPVDQERKFTRKRRGYARLLLADSRNRIEVLPPEILGRLAQVAESLTHEYWWLVLYECIQPGLVAQGYPAWRVTSGYSGWLRAYVLKGPDFRSHAARILGQVDAVRSLLEDARKAAPATKLEPG